MVELIYALANGWLLALMCFMVAGINVYLGMNGKVKQWPNRLKSINWIVLGSVYLADAITDLPAADVRIWFRIAFALMVAGELAYNADVILDILHSARAKVMPERE